MNDDEPLKSVRFVMDSIHLSPEHISKYPETYTQQTESANGFKNESSIQIDCCIGAIDGMLVWINKPTKSDQIT